MIRTHPIGGRLTETTRGRDPPSNVRSPVCGMISDLDLNVAKLRNRLEALKTGPTRADIA